MRFGAVRARLLKSVKVGRPVESAPLGCSGWLCSEHRGGEALPGV